MKKSTKGDIERQSKIHSLRVSFINFSICIIYFDVDYEILELFHRLLASDRNLQ